MRLSCSSIIEFNSLPSASILLAETLSKVSDIIAISMFNIIRGIMTEAKTNKIQTVRVYSSVLKSPYIKLYMWAN